MLVFTVRRAKLTSVSFFLSMNLSLSGTLSSQWGQARAEGKRSSTVLYFSEFFHCICLFICPYFCLCVSPNEDCTYVVGWRWMFNCSAYLIFVTSTTSSAGVKIFGVVSTNSEITLIFLFYTHFKIIVFQNCGYLYLKTDNQQSTPHHSTPL